MSMRYHNLREGIRIMLTYKEDALRANWGKFSGVRATISAPSAAWVNKVRWTHLGPSSQDPIKAKCRSESQFEFTPKAQQLFDKWRDKAASSGIALTDVLRGGGCYYAGPYQNKQIRQWIKNIDVLSTVGTDIYRTDIYRVSVRPLLARLIAEEHDQALEIMDRAYTQPELAIGNKSPDTGTGLRRPLSNRGQLVEAFKQRGAGFFRDSLAALRRDILRSKEAQVAMYEGWPERVVHVDGFEIWAGLAGGSRDDSSVTEVTRLPDGSYVWRWESDVRAVNTLPHSWASNSLATPPSMQHREMSKYLAPGYAHPMDYERWVDALVVPPCTASFVGPGDRVAIDMDWGVALPSPTASIAGDRLIVNIPKVEFNSGADQLIGVGNASIGVGGHVTPEMSSGRGATRRQYQVTVDYPISLLLMAHHIHFDGRSNGDDQCLIVSADDVPEILRLLAPHTKMKGSRGNWVFRGGRQLAFDNHDHLMAGIMPRPTKTSTSAKALESLGIEKSDLYLGIGDSRLFEVARIAAESVEEQWRIAPGVFFTEGTPAEVASTLKSPAVRTALKELAEVGIVDLHGLTTEADL